MFFRKDKDPRKKRLEAEERRARCWDNLPQWVRKTGWLANLLCDQLNLCEAHQFPVGLCEWLDVTEPAEKLIDQAMGILIDSRNGLTEYEMIELQQKMDNLKASMNKDDHGRGIYEVIVGIEKSTVELSQFLEELKTKV